MHGADHLGLGGGQVAQDRRAERVRVEVDGLGPRGWLRRNGCGGVPGQREDAAVVGSGVHQGVEPAVEVPGPRELGVVPDGLGDDRRGAGAVEPREDLAVEAGRGAVGERGPDAVQQIRGRRRDRVVGAERPVAAQEGGEPLPTVADLGLLPRQVGVELREDLAQLPALVVGEDVGRLLQAQTQLSQAAGTGQARRSRRP